MGKIRTLGIGAVVGGGAAYAAKRFVERSERAGRAVGARSTALRSGRAAGRRSTT